MCTELTFSLLLRWLRLGLTSQWEPIIAPALKFVVFQGRMKFTLPIYTDMNRWEKSRGPAVETFKANRKYMHPTTAGLVAKELKVD
jgi:leukotriene-A4 hydrolase